MAYAANTNILLRWIEPGTVACEQTRNAVKALHDAGETVSITPQNIVEFWSVATRPLSANGMGLTPEQADAEASALEMLFPLLPDTSAIHAEWRRLVVTNHVTGVRCHDARIAAALHLHGITNILTFNVDDFRGFGRLIAVNPTDIAANPNP